MLGQGVQPLRWDPLADIMPLAELQQKAEGLRSRLHEAISRMPTHQQFIEGNCKSA
jgi:tryptophan halogenase